jgi:preprotein translocase subunit SecA
MLHAVDTAWKDHLLALDHLKEGIGLRGYGQRDPLNEYKRESFELFEAMKERIEDAEVVQYVLDAAAKHFDDKEAGVGSEIMRQLEKHLMLNVLDQGWKEHLARMDYLRQGIHLRGYAQKQPKQEYKRESFELFSELLDKVKRDVTAMLARVRIRSEEEVQQLEAEDRRRMEAQANRMQFQHAEAGGYGADEEAAEAQAMAAMGMGVLAAGQAAPKVGRNDPCPCGSGLRFQGLLPALGSVSTG